MNEHLSKPRIVCAANRITYVDRTGNTVQVVIAGARHCDGVMNPIRKLLLPEIHNREFGVVAEGDGLPSNFISEEQGFIDQHGTFYTREQAFVVATENKQIVRSGSWNNSHRLYSENLY